MKSRCKFTSRVCECTLRDCAWSARVRACESVCGTRARMRRVWERACVSVRASGVCVRVREHVWRVRGVCGRVAH